MTFEPRPYAGDPSGREPAPPEGCAVVWAGWEGRCAATGKGTVGR